MQLHQEVANTLCKETSAWTFVPGSFEDEVALCKRVEISRASLCVALKVQTSECLLLHELSRDWFVREVTEQNLDDDFTVIALLKGRIADCYTINFAIYEAIIPLADNVWLSHSTVDFCKLLKLSRWQSLEALTRLLQSLPENITVFAALESRDSEGAEVAMRTHLGCQLEALRQVRNQQSQVSS